LAGVSPLPSYSSMPGWTDMDRYAPQLPKKTKKVWIRSIGPVAGSNLGRNLFFIRSYSSPRLPCKEAVAKTCPIGCCTRDGNGPKTLKHNVLAPGRCLRIYNSGTRLLNIPPPNMTLDYYQPASFQCDSPTCQLFGDGQFAIAMVDAAITLVQVFSATPLSSLTTVDVQIFRCPTRLFY